MKRTLGVLIFVSSVVAGVLFFNIFFFIQTPSGGVEQVVHVERGASLDKIIRTLEEKEVISNGPLFKAYVLLKMAGGKIHAGEYRFSPGLRPRQVLALLLKGDFTTNRITIPEGWTMKEIAGYLGGLKLVNPENFLLKCSDPNLIHSLNLNVPNLEGYLFPDTYEIYKPKNEEEVVRKLVNHLKEVYSKGLEERARERGLTQHQVMTLASIVEKETGSKTERPIVASVFLNRLKKGMPLASDPTIIYGLPHFNGNLTHENLVTPGLYNTYLNSGLPPTPICNPGLDSIKAVLYPAETNYLFFVSKNDGTHQFSETEEGHLAAVRKYQSSRPRQAPETGPKVSR